MGMAKIHADSPVVLVVVVWRAMVLHFMCMLGLFG